MKLKEILLDSSINLDKIKIEFSITYAIIKLILLSKNQIELIETIFGPSEFIHKALGKKFAYKLALSQSDIELIASEIDKDIAKLDKLIQLDFFDCELKNNNDIKELVLIIFNFVKDANINYKAQKERMKLIKELNEK